MGTNFQGKMGFASATGSYNGGRTLDGGTCVTEDATATVIYTIPLAEGEAIKINAEVLGVKTDLAAGLGADLAGEYRRASGGNVTAVGSPSVTVREDSSGAPTVAFNANTSAQTVEIKVTGIAAEDWRWEAAVQYLKV